MTNAFDTVVFSYTFLCVILINRENSQPEQVQLYNRTTAVLQHATQTRTKLNSQNQIKLDPNQKTRRITKK